MDDDPASSHQETRTENQTRPQPFTKTSTKQGEENNKSKCVDWHLSRFRNISQSGKGGAKSIIISDESLVLPGPQFYDFFEIFIIASYRHAFDWTISFHPQIYKYQIRWIRKVGGPVACLMMIMGHFLCGVSPPADQDPIVPDMDWSGAGDDTLFENRHLAPSFGPPCANVYLTISGN